MFSSEPISDFNKYRLALEITANGGTNCDFQGADLSRTGLFEADLSRAELNYADLSEADLTRADLRGADLRAAVLEGATVTNEQLAQAESLEGATLPDGTKHE